MIHSNRICSNFESQTIRQSVSAKMNWGAFRLLGTFLFIASSDNDGIASSKLESKMSNTERMYYCPKCNQAFVNYIEFAGGVPMCPNCYKTPVHALDVDEMAWETASESERNRIVQEGGSKPKQPEYKEAQGRKESGVSLKTDALPLVLGFVGSAFFVMAGIKMLGITSRATANGDIGTIAEAFYNAMGLLSFGLACVSATIGYIGWKKQ